MEKASETLTVDIQEEKFSYPIYIGAGLRNRLGSIVKEYYSGDKIFLVSDKNVFELYGKKITSSLQGVGFSVTDYILPPGERAKSRKYLFRGYDMLVDNDFQRDNLVLVLGGGVPGDLGGYLAASYMRGINLIQVPTTLLAQVDSSVGGKTAINHPGGKNLIGAFYQPGMVIIDIEFLQTLATSELKTGLAEVIKHALIKDKDFFDFLINRRKDIYNLKPSSVIEAVKKCCHIKAGVVSRDQKEKGERALLNFGHTLGHALEAVNGYGEYTHGQAVAVGMRAATDISVKLGLLNQKYKDSINKILDDYKMPAKVKGRTDELLSVMKHDKKARAGQLRWILLKEPGNAIIKEGVPENAIIESIKELKK